jgi:hypothetical protein
MMVDGMYWFISRKTWSVIDWVNSLLPAPSEDIQLRKKKLPRKLPRLLKLPVRR